MLHVNANLLGASPCRPFVAFSKDDTGATAIEYGLIAALVSVVIITAARGRWATT